MTGHLTLLLVFSILVGAFFALLVRETPREILRLFVVMTLSMILLSLAAAYVMYPFPLG